MDFDRLFNRHVPSKYIGDCCEILARAILIVNDYTASRWSLRVSEQNGFMLKVGTHEVVQFVNGWAHFIVDRSSVPADLRRKAHLYFSGTKDYYGNFDAVGYYPSNPGTEACDTRIENAKELFGQIQDSFTKVVMRAAKTRSHPSIRSTHSKEFVEYLRWRTGVEIQQPSFVSIKESRVVFSRQLVEGTVQQRLVTTYERDPKAREQCLQYYGTRCHVCMKSMEEVYGEIGKDIIHVHHVIPISTHKEAHTVNPIEDMRPICPNCHAVIHSRVPPYSLDEVRAAYLSKSDQS